MELIKDTVINVVASLALKKTALGSDDPQTWLKRVLTKKESGHIKVKYFKKGVLGLTVDSSSWLYNFSLQKDRLLEKLQHKSSAIKDIRFNIGEIKRENCLRQ